MSQSTVMGISTNHTFSWTSLTKRLTSTSLADRVQLLNQQKEENDHTHYFMVNLHEITENRFFRNSENLQNLKTAD